MNYYLLISLILAAISGMFSITRQFQMLQQNSYFPSRYTKWLKENFEGLPIYLFTENQIVEFAISVEIDIRAIYFHKSLLSFTNKNIPITDAILAIAFLITVGFISSFPTKIHDISTI